MFGGRWREGGQMGGGLHAVVSNVSVCMVTINLEQNHDQSSTQRALWIYSDDGNTSNVHHNVCLLMLSNYIHEFSVLDVYGVIKPF